MGKTRIGRKEYNTIQEFKHKIQALKRENDDLRKRLARIKLDEYGQLKKTIKKHYKKEETQQGVSPKKNNVDSNRPTVRRNPDLKAKPLRREGSLRKG